MSILLKIKSIFGLREIILIAGLCLLWYGLFLFMPWVSYAIIGLILLTGGFFMRDE